MQDSSQPYRHWDSRRWGASAFDDSASRSEGLPARRKELSAGDEGSSSCSAIFVSPSPEYNQARFDAGHFAPYGPYEVRATNRVALACFAVTLFNLIFGTLSLITGPYFSLLVSLVGIALGHIALHQLRRSEESGRTLARFSLGLNYLALFGVTLIVVAFVMFTSFGRVLFGV